MKNLKILFTKYTQNSKKTDQISINDIFDEKDAAIKLLLPSIQNKNILYVGDSINNVTQNLAKDCRNLVHLCITSSTYEIKKIELSTIGSLSKGICIGQLSKKKLAQFSNHYFDGIIFDLELDFYNQVFDSNNLTSELLIQEILRLNNNDSWLFMKTENVLNRSLLKKYFFIQLLTCIESRKLISLDQLNKSGYKKVSKYGFDQILKTVTEVINLDSNSQISSLKSQGSFSLKLFPNWLYVLTIPSCSSLFSRKIIHTNIEEIVANINLLDKNSEYVVSNMKVNHKHKCIVFLTDKRNTNNNLLVKVPLDNSSEKHIQKNFYGIATINSSFLHENVKKYFPRPISHDQIDTIKFYTETFELGTPWIHISKTSYFKSLISECIKLLANIQTFKLLPDKRNQSNIIQNFKTVRNYIIEKKIIDVSKISPIFNIISEKEMSAKRLFLYKSDFSISNILINDMHVHKIIDLDYWGWSSNKLIDFADFITSYSRCFHGIEYDAILDSVLRQDITKIPSELNIEENLNLLGSTHDELKDALIISRLNTISHHLDMDKYRLNTKWLNEVQSLLIHPGLIGVK